MDWLVPDLNSADNDPNPGTSSPLVADDTGAGGDIWSKFTGALGQVLDYRLKSEQLDYEVDLAQRGYSFNGRSMLGDAMPARPLNQNQLITWALLGVALVVAVKLLKD